MRISSNVLKLRKEAELATRQADTSSTRAVPSGNIIHNVPKRINQVGKKRAESGSKSTSVSPPKMGAPAAKHPLELYNKSFRVSLGEKKMFQHITDTVLPSQGYSEGHGAIQNWLDASRSQGSTQQAAV